MFREISPITQLMKVLGLEGSVEEKAGVPNGVEELLQRMRSRLQNANENHAQAQTTKSNKQELRTCEPRATTLGGFLSAVSASGKFGGAGKPKAFFKGDIQPK